MKHTAIVNIEKVVILAIMTSIVMADWNLSMAIRDIKLKSIKN